MYFISYLCFCLLSISVGVLSLSFNCEPHKPENVTMKTYNTSDRHSLTTVRYSIYEQLADKLNKECKDFYDFNTVFFEDIKDIKISDFKTHSLISLFVHGYHTNTSEKFNKAIVYAGDVYYNVSVQLHLFNVNNTPKESTSKNISSICRTSKNSTSKETCKELNLKDTICKQINLNAELCKQYHLSKITCKNIDSSDSLCNQLHLNDTVCKQLELNNAACQQKHATVEPEEICKCEKSYSIDGSFKKHVKSMVQNITIKASKIMSKHLAESNPDLLNYVTKLDFEGKRLRYREECSGTTEDVKDLKTVVVCLDNDEVNLKGLTSSHLKYVIVNTDECQRKIEQYKNTLLAVVAAEPFDMDYVFNVPTVFYKTPYINPEYKTYFPNSINIIRGQLLPDAFVRFIQEFGWRRVGVISDDAPYSHQFEDILLKQFHEKGIIYNVQRCENNNCAQAVNNLKKMDARIVIANVEKRNTDLLQIPPSWTCLYRVVPYAYSAISITLGSAPMDNERICDDFCRNSPACNEVLNAIEAITQTKSTFKTYRQSRKEFYRSFTTEIEKQINPNTEARVIREKYVWWHMQFNGAKVFDRKGRAGALKIFGDNVPNAELSCFTKTNNFAKPCDTSLILLFMFIVLTLCITIMVISCYFDSASPIHGTRYQQL